MNRHFTEEKIEMLNKDEEVLNVANYWGDTN